MTLMLLGACGGASAEKKKKKTKTDSEVAQVEEESPADEEKKEDEEEKSDEDPAHDGKAEKGAKEPEKGEEHKEEGEKVSLQPIWDDLLRGNKQFMIGKYSVGDLIAERRELAKGQHPKVIVLSCADSRVPPELVFGKNTGDLFVVRDAGNIVDPVELGSMEYAVEHLNAKVIVVLGHESCGAVAATVSGQKMPTRNLQAIVDTISPALKGSKDCPIGGKMNRACVDLNVNQTAKHLTSRSPILKEAVEQGHLAIVKAVYKLETGEVERID